jgi:hypothetical protein
MLRYIPHGFINAKPRKDILAEMARDGFIISDRAFRAAVKKAVRNKEALICTTAHGGYYIPVTAEDLEISLREDNSRISKLIADREAKRAMARERGII